MQQAKVFRKEVVVPVELRYLLYLPKAYDQDPNRRWPLVLFLHGAGERGSKLDNVRKYGPPGQVDRGADFPFILVSPQCPARHFWRSDELGPLLDEIEQSYRVDPDRIYVTGLSMGGYGTWALAIAQPHRFAAIAPVCGGGEASAVGAISHLPVWVFHGAKDDIVPLGESESMVEALRRRGGSPRLTVYPEAKHDSWTETYANPELYQWLLDHRRE